MSTARSSLLIKGRGYEAAPSQQRSPRYGYDRSYGYVKEKQLE